MRKEREQKRKSRIKIRKQIIVIAIIVLITIAVISLNYDDIFQTYTTKNITYKLGEYDLKSMTQDIIDGNIILPYPKEIGIMPEEGEIFSGYDINGDGISDYEAGDLVPVTANSRTIEIRAITKSDNMPFTAWLYEDSAHTVGVELTSAGATSTPWDYTKTVRYLVIDPKFTESIGGTIEIVLPVGMQWYDNDTDISTTTWTGITGSITSVEFEELSGLDGTGGQGAGIYSNPRTGTITYTYHSLATDEELLVIPVTYDYSIWNKAAGTNNNLTGDFDPITVTMTEGSNVYSKTLTEVEFSNPLTPYFNTYYTPKVFGTDLNNTVSYPYLSNASGYYEKVVIEFILPTDGTNYATFIEEKVGSHIDLNSKFTIDSSDPTKVVYTAYDLIINDGTRVEPVISLDSSKFSIGEQVSYGYVLTTTSYGGVVHTHRTNVNATIVENVSLGIEANSKSTLVNYTQEVETLLGMLSIKNDGQIASEKVKMNYVFDSSIAINSNKRNSIDVRAFAAPQNLNTNFDLEYVLVDKYSNEVGRGIYNITSSNTMRATTLITIKELVDSYNAENPANILNVEEVSIKQITYEIDYILPNTRYIYVGASNSFAATGTYYGKFNSSTTAYSTLTITEYDDQGNIKETQEKRASSTRSSLHENSLELKNIIIQETNYSAGEKISVQAQICNYTYPYTASQFSDNPHLYVILPSGVTIVEEDLFALFKGETLIPYIKLEVNKATGENVYTIWFDQGVVELGGPFFDENYILHSANSSGDLIISMNLTTAPTANYTAVNLNNSLFVGEPNMNMQQFAAREIIEPYDFDGDGSLNKNVVIYNYAKKEISINPNTNQFEFTNEISINDKEYTTTDTSYILSDVDGNIDSGVASYNLRIQNNSEGLIAGEDFYHYIPIPKTGVTYPKEMNVANTVIDFVLTSEPQIVGDNGLIYDIKYTTKRWFTDTSGNIFIQESEWLSIDEVTDLSEVTMIKITGLPRTIVQSHTEDIISLNLKYQTKSGYVSTGYDSGKLLTFNSFGWQKYLEGGVENTENIYTEANTVNTMLRYVTEYDKEILASYDIADDKTVTFELPSYFENKDMYVLSVKEYNVDLVTAAEINANQHIVDTNITDRNFSITAKLDNGTTQELSSYIDTPISLGVITADTNSSILFEIENYDNMADDASTKYVDVILGDDKGIKYTVRLNISRNAKHVDEPVTAIAEGMLYKLINNGKTSVTITEDSSMTMQYDFMYIAATHNDIKFNFTTNLPVGTKIRMIDSSDLLTNDEGDYIFKTSYFYYEVGVETASISLLEFKDMNTGEAFDIGTDLRNERAIFTFIVEFDDNYLPLGSYTASIEPILIDGTSTEKYDLHFNIVEKREFEVTTSTTDYVIQDDKVDVTVNFGTNVLSGIDTKYRNEVLALRIRFNQDIPLGSYIEIQDKIYLLEESDFILNYGNYFLIPLGNIEDIESVNYTLHAPMDNYVAGSIYHELVFAEEPQGESYAEVTNSFTVIDPPPPAMNLIVNDNNELVLRENLSNLKVDFDYIDYDETTTFTVRLYIMEKSEGAYLRQTNLIESVVADGTISTPEKGIITLNPDDNLKNVELTINLNEALMKTNTTYRIVVETNHLGEEKYEDLINFIVIDDIY